jgi:NAD(P)-dependent dehydrogenase (short-subunit alcohol dehydrogenase family)
VIDQPIAVITGAAGGVGSACVAELGSAGFWTIGVDVRPESDADEHLTVDMASPVCGNEIAAGVGQRVVEVLVNNAAVGAGTTLLDASVESWDGMMAVNLRAPFLTARALHPALVASGRGVIVNISSVHARASSAGVGVYATSKAGLDALTRAMALEWGPQIRANCVLPGAVDTPMLRHGLERSQQTIEEIAERHPIGRVASPAEIARLVRFLVVEGTFMTGASVVVDGGALARLSTE